jgi:hypothetical protein
MDIHRLTDRLVVKMRATACMHVHHHNWSIIVNYTPRCVLSRPACVSAHMWFGVCVRDRPDDRSNAWNIHEWYVYGMRLITTTRRIAAQIIISLARCFGRYNPFCVFYTDYVTLVYQLVPPHGLKITNNYNYYLVHTLIHPLHILSNNCNRSS